MADVITRLKVDSQEYDSKIKRAADGILQLERTVREAGESFLATWKDEQEFAKSLGQMETVSRTARGKISELTSAFTDLSMTYKRMTDEEKASPFGKALQGSLDQLKGRIQEAKKDLADINKELGNTGKEGQNAGNILDQLAGKFGISTKALTTWGAAIGAGAAALKVAKDAFLATEQGIDDWGRTVNAAEGAYNEFLDTLNNGNWSQFFDNLETAINGGMDLYDVLDRLGSIKSNNQAAISIVQAQLQQLRLAKQQGENVDAQIDAATKRLAYLQKQSIEQGKKAGVQTAEYSIRNSANSMKGASVSDKSIDAAVQGIMKNGQSEFDKYRETVKKFESWSQAQTKEIKTITDEYGKVLSTYEVNKFDISKLTKEQQTQYKLAKAITDKETEIQKGISIYAQAVQEEAGSAREQFRANRYKLQRPIGSGSGNKLTDQEKAQAKFEQAEKDYQQALEQAALELKAGTANTAEAKKKELSAAENLWNSIGDAREIYDSEELKKAQEDAAKKVVELGGSVNTLIEEQKKAQEAARELTTAQKKAAEANRKMADALAANDYKAYSAAYKQYQTAKADVQRLGGELPKLDGKKIVYTVEVDDEQLAKLKDLQTDDKTIKINVEEGRVNLPLLPKDNETIHFNVEPGEVNLPDIPKIYTVTIEAETDQAVRNIDAAVADMNSMKVEIPVSVEKPEPVEVPVNMSYTDNNLSAFIGNLKQELSQAPLGSELYKNLTAQLADANMLANLMQTAVKNGIDAAQFDPQTLFNKIFGENPGDYIDDAKWQDIRKKIEEIIGKPITIDVNTGTVNVENAKGKSAEKGKNDYNKIVGSMSTITGALQQLGVEVPEGFSKTLGILQVISTITMAIQSLAAVTATTSALKAIPIIGWFLHNGGMVPEFANGGLIGKAAGGMMIPGNSFSGDNLRLPVDGGRGMIGVNSGELILNKAQQGNLASQLQDGGNGGNVGRSMATIESDQIRIVLQNGAQAKGMTLGEYLGI